MAAHVHAWQPWEGRSARYWCACGSSGYRDIVDGAIVPHRHQQGTPQPRPSVRPGTAGRKPDLDDYDRGRR